MSTTTKIDLYQEVTDTIVKALEKGAERCQPLWNMDFTNKIALPIRSNGLPYQGVNVVLLWAAQKEHSFVSSQWFTFKQAQALGAQVRKGETATRVVFADAIRSTNNETNDNAEHCKEVVIPFLKRYWVFNADQIDGLPEQSQSVQQAIPTPAERIAALEDFISATGAKIVHGGNDASYSQSRDLIRIPEFSQFPIAEHYYSVLSHELTHWTSHESRCNRVLSKRFGDAAYAAEELIAELGAAFLCAHLGIVPKTLDNHVNYLASWLKLLKGDKKAIFTAASAAQKAANFIQQLASHQEPLMQAA